MNKFEYTYNLKRKTKKYVHEYPSSWNELSKEDLLYVSRLMNLNLPVEKFNIFLLRRFLGIPNKFLFSIDSKIFTELADTITFIHEKKELTLNKLPELKIKKGLFSYILHGPESGMFNLSHEQFFGYCEPSFSNMISTGNNDYLDYLIASLYTFEKGVFNSSDVEKIKALVKRLKPEFKTAILLFYMGSKDFFAYKFPKLFKNGSGNAKGLQSDLYFIELTDQLNSQNLSNNDQIKKTNILEVFMRLTKMIELSDQLKQKKK